MSRLCAGTGRSRECQGGCWGGAARISTHRANPSPARLIKERPMRLRVLSSLLLLSFACELAAQTNQSVERFSPLTRTFRFSYKFTVKDVPAGTKRMRVWIPVAQNDSHQTVRLLSVKAPAKMRSTREPEYGNRMVYAEILNPAPGRAEFALEYEVKRHEHSRGGYEQLERADRKPAVVSA